MRKGSHTGEPCLTWDFYGRTWSQIRRSGWSIVDTEAVVEDITLCVCWYAYRGAWWPGYYQNAEKVGIATHLLMACVTDEETMKMEWFSGK